MLIQYVIKHHQNNSWYNKSANTIKYVENNASVNIIEFVYTIFKYKPFNAREPLDAQMLIQYISKHNWMFIANVWIQYFKII